MNAIEIIQQADDEMRKWGLLDEPHPWSAHICYMGEDTFGQCSPTPRQIRLSTLLVDRASQAVILDITRHEIAHALEFVRHGKSDHGARWKKIAREVGATPSSEGPANLAEYGYTYVVSYGDRVLDAFYTLTDKRRSSIRAGGILSIPESLGNLEVQQRQQDGSYLTIPY
jgi:hypothetical protein